MKQSVFIAILGAISFSAIVHAAETNGDLGNVVGGNAQKAHGIIEKKCTSCHSKDRDGNQRCKAKLKRERGAWYLLETVKTDGKEITINTIHELINKHLQKYTVSAYFVGIPGTNLLP